MNVSTLPLLPEQVPSLSAPGVPSAEPALLRLRLIGHMQAWAENGARVLPSGRKTRALLAMLALAAPRQVPRGRLAETLWSRRPEDQARASLRQEIHRLLDALSPLGEDVLAITRDHLSIRPGRVWTDVEEVLRATPDRPGALSLLDGDLLDDLEGLDPAFDTWLAAERERLRDRARMVAEVVLREQADPEVAIPAAQQLLVIDRAHEGAWRALMRSHAGRGERGMAIEAYERCRAALADLLDAPPSEETQRLILEIRAGSRPTPPRAVPEPVPLPAPQPAPALLPEAPMAVAPGPGRSVRSGPRVGILPPLVLGLAAAEQGLGVGLAEEITAALARFRWMNLVSSAALARFAAETRDELALRRAFGLDFLLDGTVQRGPRHGSQGTLRITMRLIDLRAGNQVIWARRFDRSAADPLALQDEIAAEVAAQAETEMMQAEALRAAAAHTGRAGPGEGAAELILRATPLILRFDRASFMAAGDLLTQALALEPDSAPAHAWLAGWHAVLLEQNWADDRAAVREHTIRLAERAVLLDPQDGRNLTFAGHIRAAVQGRLREGLVLHERALQLNPNLAMAWNFSGLACTFLGELEEAERRLRRYKVLAPMHPKAGVLDSAFVTLALLKGEHEEAVAVAREICETSPGLLRVLPPYLAALGHLGRQPEAALVLHRLLLLDPGFTIAGFLAATPFVCPEHRDMHAEGLRRAGAPEGNMPT